MTIQSHLLAPCQGRHPRARRLQRPPEMALLLRGRARRARRVRPQEPQRRRTSPLPRQAIERNRGHNDKHPIIHHSAAITLTNAWPSRPSARYRISQKGISIFTDTLRHASRRLSPTHRRRDLSRSSPGLRPETRSLRLCIEHDMVRQPQRSSMECLELPRSLLQ